LKSSAAVRLGLAEGDGRQTYTVLVPGVIEVMLVMP